MGLTKNQRIYAGLIAIYTMVMAYHLHKFHEEGSFHLIPYIVVGYAVVMLITGIKLALTDSIRNSRHDSDFIYHLQTYVITNVIGLTWIIFWRPDEIDGALIGISVWSLFMLAHYFASKKSIKGMKKEEVFK